MTCMCKNDLTGCFVCAWGNVTMISPVVQPDVLKHSIKLSLTDLYPLRIDLHVLRSSCPAAADRVALGCVRWF